MSKTRKTLVVTLLTLGVILFGLGSFIKLEHWSYNFYCSLLLIGLFSAITALVLVMRSRKA